MSPYPGGRLKRHARSLPFVFVLLALAGCEPKAPAPAATATPSAPTPPGTATAPPPAPPPDSLDLPILAPTPGGPIRRGPEPPPLVLKPPFGGEGALLDHYEFGGIGGFGDRIRVVGDAATLFHFDDVVVTAPLTAEEGEALAALLATLGPIEWQAGNSGVPDGQSNGLFFAGRGTGKDDGGPGRLAKQLRTRLRAAAPR